MEFARLFGRRAARSPSDTSIAALIDCRLRSTGINGFVNIQRMEWEIIYYSEALQRAIMDLPAGIQARYIHLTQRMLTFGPNLGMPHTRAMGSGLFELRMKSKEGIGRVFYCTVTGQRIMMLHAFVKKSPKTPARELEVAKTRLREVVADADA